MFLKVRKTSLFSAIFTRMNLEAKMSGEDPFPYLRDAGGINELFRTHNWSATQLGDPQTWPANLHAAVNISLNSGFPIAIYWGDDFTLLYNEAYSAIPGNKHPWALGKPGKIAWAEIWDGLERQFHDVLKEGKVIRSPDSLLLMQRYGYTEECYFDYSLSPIRDAQGNIGGVFNAVIETTYRVLNERRNRILNQFAKAVNTPRSKTEALTIIGEQLETVIQDIPFCLLYAVEKDQSRLELVSGIEKDSMDQINWPLNQIRKQNSSIVIKQLGEYISTPISTYWPECCEEAMIVPLKNSVGTFSGFMVAGINPRKRLGNEYKYFIEQVAGYISTTISNGKIYEEEISIRKQLVQREDSLRRKIEEQLKLVALVNNSVDLMSILELDGKNSYVNPAGMDMLGFESYEHVLSTPIAHLHTPDDIEFVQQLVLPAIMNEGKWSGQMNVRHLRTGEIFPVYNNAIRIDDPETNQTIAVGAVMRDLRPELASQKALIESERNLRSIIIHAPVAMCIMMGSDFVIEIANEMMIQLWGKTSEEVINRPVFDAVPEARRQGLEEVLMKVYHSGESFKANEREVHLLRNGNIESVYLNFAYEPYHNSEGKISGILAVAIEVTQQGDRSRSN